MRERLNGKFYARFQKMIYLHLFTDCFMKISSQSLEQMQYHRMKSLPDAFTRVMVKVELQIVGS